MSRIPLTENYLTDNETREVHVFHYKFALGKECHMAIFEKDRSKAMKTFISNREPTDRLIGESFMSKSQYRDWKKSL